MIRTNLILISILFFITSIHCNAQNYEVGEHYFHENEYVEYVHGNYPIIISSPHGGEKKPEGIPDRDCVNCVVVNDSYTQELTNEIAEEIENITGCLPYIIINRLHRSKLDANRGIIEGADGNPEAESAWRFYHEHIATSQDSIHSNNERGLLVDIHGHAHDIQRLELGYLLSKSQLNEDDEILEENNYAEFSSIRQLTLDNISALSFSELLRGDYSLGTLIAEEGYPALPSSDDEFPENNSYFTGGYITQQYGSRNQDITDAIQIECNQDVRFNTTIRKDFAKKLAQNLVDYMEMHYGFDNSKCNSTSVQNIPNQNFSIHPNPASNFITFTNQSNFRAEIFNFANQKIMSRSTKENSVNLDIRHLPNGLYYVRFSDHKGYEEVHRFIKSDH